MRIHRLVLLLGAAIILAKVSSAMEQSQELTLPLKPLASINSEGQNKGMDQEAKGKIALSLKPLKPINKEEKNKRMGLWREAGGMIAGWDMSEFGATLQKLSPITAGESEKLQQLFVAQLAKFAHTGAQEKIKELLNNPYFEPGDLINEEVILGNINVTVLHALLSSDTPQILAVLDILLNSPKVAKYLRLRQILATQTSSLKVKNEEPILFGALMQDKRYLQIMHKISPLHMVPIYRCNKDDVEIAKRLLTLPAEDSSNGNIIDAQDLYGNTAAHLAAKKGCVKLLALLKEQGADFSIKNMWGVTVDQLITVRNAIITADLSVMVDAIEGWPDKREAAFPWLLETINAAKIDKEAKVAIVAFIADRWARAYIARGDIGAFTRLQKYLLPNDIFLKNKSLLTFAVQRQEEVIVRLLLTMGATVDEQTLGMAKEMEEFGDPEAAAKISKLLKAAVKLQENSTEGEEPDAEADGDNE
ncbi:MAG: hypothetical protein M1549_02510 [Candidatus Dependentiae bacterium]|nr:hypothetical protein [Candidatus Dependentiae bacterium]